LFNLKNMKVHVRVLLLVRCKKLLVLSITFMFGIALWINKALLYCMKDPL